jgi:hypothetical protein
MQTHLRPLLFTKVSWVERIAVDAPGSDLLAPAALQSFVYAYYQRIPFGHERLYGQDQEHAAGLPTRPASTAQDSVVAMEALLLVQAHRTQVRADR